jgi:hypothetical protein
MQGLTCKVVCTSYAVALAGMSLLVYLPATNISGDEYHRSLCGRFLLLVVYKRDR